MESTSFNKLFLNNSFSNADVLSAFKEKSQKDLSIHQGMSVNEISEIVSENLIKVVKAQFEATKVQFEQTKAKQ